MFSQKCKNMLTLESSPRMKRMKSSSYPTMLDQMLLELRQTCLRRARQLAVVLRRSLPTCHLSRYHQVIALPVHHRKSSRINRRCLLFQAARPRRLLRDSRLICHRFRFRQVTRQVTLPARSSRINRVYRPLQVTPQVALPARNFRMPRAHRPLRVMHPRVHHPKRRP